METSCSDSRGLAQPLEVVLQQHWGASCPRISITHSSLLGYKHRRMAPVKQSQRQSSRGINGVAAAPLQGHTSKHTPTEGAETCASLQP